MKEFKRKGILSNIMNSPYLKYVVFILGLLVGYFVKEFYVYSISNKTDALPVINTSTSNNIVKVTIPEISKKSEFTQLDKIEEEFESTLRSCLGPKCFNQVVKLNQNSNDEVYRIGLLALPYSGSEVLMEILTYLNSQTKSNIKFHIINEMHVPAYGYGKNHGWSSIIRISRRVINHAYSIIEKNKLSSSMELFEAQISQITIFQCRNSHVAAHTRMLTVFVDQLYSRPLFELEKIITYIGLEYDRKSLLSIVPKFHDNFIKSLHETTVPDEFYQRGLKILKHELDTTDNMRNWPCKSFIKGIKLQNLLPIKPYEIAANCSSSFVTCSVPFDKEGG